MEERTKEFHDMRYALQSVEESALDQKSICDIRNLADAFERFGYNKEDIIDKREQIVMFRKIRIEMEDMLSKLTRDGKYTDASEIRDRLRLIKEEFLNLQRVYDFRSHQEENNSLNLGRQIVWKKYNHRWDTKSKDVKNVCQKREDDLLITHRVQRDQLDTFLENIPQPRVKFSKNLLDLKNSEHNLSKLKLYEDARNVYARSESVERAEFAKNIKDFEAYKYKKRADLQAKQYEELKALREKNTELKFGYQRAREWSHQVTNRRLSNLREDMYHAHCLSIQNPVEFTTRPVIVPRKGIETSSIVRGQQLLSSVKGKRLEVASLCALHDDENGVIPSGSVVY